MKGWMADPEDEEGKEEERRVEKDSWRAKEIQTQTQSACEVESIEKGVPTGEKVLLEPT
ncbi:hypothetical protein HS141_16745, partial [Cetobacterium somerae]|nr:hypothetical protein [Cetobacterium somerae]